MKLKIPPPLQALILAFLMWFVARYSSVGGIHIPYDQAILAVFILAGIVVDALAITAFVQSKTTINPLKPEASSSLVVGGIYRLTRNPMYVGMLCLLCAWCVYLGSVVNIVCLVVFVMYMTRFQIKPEEQALERLFGREYLSYKEKTRRWL